jgi:hypothetical protein
MVVLPGHGDGVWLAFNSNDQANFKSVPLDAGALYNEVRFSSIITDKIPLFPPFSKGDFNSPEWSKESVWRKVLSSVSQG